jgi:hypothetical protein
MRGYEIHTIAGLPDRAFDAVVKSGAISQADIAAARALRTGRTAKRHEQVTIRKSSVEREEVQMESVAQKIERAQDYAVVLRDAVAAYAKAHGCTRAIAMEAVLAHPATSEYVRLDKELEAAKREAAALRKLEGTAPNNHPINTSTPAKTPLVVRPSESGRVSSNDAPTADPDLAESAAEVLEMIVNAQLRANPTLSRAKATVIAGNDPRFTQAHRAEKLKKGL